MAAGDEYVGIEALRGTDFADQLGGTTGDEMLWGEGGNDLLEGRAGADSLFGGKGDDRIKGGAGADLVDGGEGNDTADYFDDTASSGATEGVVISLAAGSASGGDAAGDTLVSIENVIGSDFDDTIEGDGGANRLEGHRGNDVLSGGAGDDLLVGGRGADTLNGGEGIDIADYTLSLAGVTVDMANGAAGSGDAEGDSFSGIEIVQGSYHDDVLRGDGGDNRLRGGLGADLLDGRGGFDTADYANSDTGVTVDLSLGQGLAGDAAGDTLISIEQVLGSNYVDTLIGSTGADWFDGGFANDDIRGGFGSDSYVVGFDSSEDVITELGAESDIDRLVLKSNILPKDVSLIRMGDDLLIELENDGGFLTDTATVKDHFLGRATGVEEIVFANGTVWDRARMEELVRAGRFNAQNDIYRFGVEDQVAVIDPATLIVNDVAEGVDRLTLVAVGNERFGSARIREDGMIEFTGAANHNGDAFFDYTVRDEFGRESTARVEVNLAPVNDAPVAVDDGPFTGNEDTILRIRIENLLVNDFDIDGDQEFEELHIVSLNPLHNEAGDALYPYRDPDYTGAATHVTWKLDGAYIEFKIRPDYFGFAGFEYVVADREGATATGHVELYIEPVNDAPRLRDQKQTVRLTTTSTITVADLMRSVYDIEGDGYSFVGMHYAANGKATDNGEAIFDAAAQTVVYTPERLTGRFESSYIAFDVIDARGAAATLHYQIGVRPLNDVPIARNDYGFRTLEDTLLVINPAALLANDSDENGDPLHFDGTYRFADNGKARINEQGMIEFRPRADFNGSAGFEYYISDGQGGTAKAWVSITVVPRNDPPLLFDDVAAGLEDKTLYVIPGEAFGNDLDLQGDVLFFQSSHVLGELATRFLSPSFTVQALAGNNEALPDWLGFDPATMTFQGTWPGGATEPVDAVVFVKDPSNNATYAYRYRFDAGDTATLAAGLALGEEIMGDFTVREAHHSSLEFVSGSLGAGNSVIARLADGSALPQWLAFNAQNWTFTGTPPQGTAAPIDVVLDFAWRATPQAVPVTYSINLALDPAALAGGMIYDSDVALFDISDGAFAVSLIGGRPLPDWLSFDLETMTLSLSGFEPDADAPVVRLQVTFTPTGQDLPDDVYSTAKKGFTLEFVIDPTKPLDPAINQLLHNDDFFAAQGLFAVDLKAAGGISASRESRAPLPGWLGFDGETLAFDGLPPSAYIGQLPVRLDVTGNGSTLPTMSILTGVTIDQTFTVEKNNGLSTTTRSERITINAPKDYNGALALDYLAADSKGAVSIDPATLVFNVTPQPEKPVAETDTVTLFESGAVTFALADLIRNDRDDDGDRLRIVALGQPANGTLTINLSTLTIAPPATLGQAAGAVWSATLADGSALPGWMTLDAATGTITAIVPFDVRANFDLRFTRTLGGIGAEAALARSFDGLTGTTVTYTPNAGFSGIDPLSYTLTDDAQGAVTGTVKLDVKSLFDPPLANADVVAAIEDTVLVIDPALLLANDSDVDNDPIRFLEVLNPSQGTVEFDGERIRFTPAPNFSGEARFEYTVTDDRHGTSVGAVKVNVQSTNRAPAAAADVFAAVEDTPYQFTAADLLANDTDPDGDAIRFVSMEMDDAKGRIIQLPGGRYQFVPDENVFGPVDFRYTITDGRKNTTGTFTFDIAAVNDAPIANEDGIYFGNQDTALVVNLADLLLNDRDVEGDAFRIVEVLDGDNGSVVQVGDTAVFTPREGYYGDAQFHYRVTDSNGADSIGTVQLIIRPEFDLPVAVSDSGFEMLEDSFIDLDPAVLMANDTAPEGTSITFIGLYGAGVSALDNGKYRFTPGANFFGQVTLTYAITNESGFAIPTTVTIDVLPVADNPVATDDALALVEDQGVTIFTSQILANDFDVDRQAIVLSRLLDSQGVSVTDNGIGQLVVTPDTDFNGAAWFDYEIVDSTGARDTARVAVSVAAVNDAPRFTLIPTLRGTEDTPFSAMLPADLVGDADGDALLVEVRGVGGSPLPEWLNYDRRTMTLSGDPPRDFNGAIRLEVSAFDGQVAVVKDVFVAIAAVNDAPVLDTPYADFRTTEDRAFDFAVATGAFSDVDGDALTLTVRQADGSALPAWASFAAGHLTGTPPADFNGALELEIIASDGSLTASDFVRLIVAAVNDRPVLVGALANVRSAEDTSLDVAIPAGIFADIDGDPLTLSAQLAGGAALPGWLVFDGVRFTGTPPQDYNGAFDIEVTASDGMQTASDVFRLTIDPANDAPVVTWPLNDMVVAEDHAFSLPIPPGTFGDVDGDTLTVAVTQENGSALPGWVSYTAGRLVGTPPPNFSGELAILVTASDGRLSVADTFLLTVLAVNDAPTLVHALADKTFAEDAAIDIALDKSAFADVDGDALSFTARRADGTALPAWLAFDGSRFSGQPPANFTGELDIEVFASDGLLAASDVFRLTISPVNDAPTLVRLLADVSVAEDTPLSVSLPTGSFIDIDGDALAFSAKLIGGAPLPTWLTFANGAFTGTPPANFNGSFDVTVTASDGALSTSDTFKVTVTAVNDAPVLAVALADKTVQSAAAIDFAIPSDSFTDVDGDQLSFAATKADGSALPTWLSFANGRFTGSAPAGTNVAYDLKVVASDGTLTASDVFRLTVVGATNTAPDAQNDGLFITLQAEQLLILKSDLLANDTDAEGNTLTIVAVQGAAHGTVALNAEGNIVYSANGDYVGADSFSYTLSDGSLSDSATVAVRVDGLYTTWSQGSGGSDKLFGNMADGNRLYGGSGDDQLKGGQEADWLAGGDGNDKINGLSGDDHLWGNAGNDQLNGNGGFDRAYFFGLRSAYSVVTANGTVSVVDNAPTVDGNDGTDTISSIEQLVFKNNETASVVSPIILDLDGNGVKTVAAADSDALYDLDGDGLADDTSWIGNTEGFLFLDRDKNGTVTNAGEFSFIDDVPGATSDLAGLKAFDSNNDGKLSSADTRFADFRVWRDADGDGAVDTGEVLTLTAAGVASLSLSGTAVNAASAFGDVAVLATGTYTRTNGATMQFLDAALTYFSASSNMVELDGQDYAFERKDSKYRISIAGGAMVLTDKKAKGMVDPGANRLGASVALAFKGKTYGMLGAVVLDLDGSGIDLRRSGKSNAVFDMDGDGNGDDTGWTSARDGILVIDRDGDGLITHAAELSLAAEDDEAMSALEGLARLDSNGDAKIDASDARFGELRVWVDANANGATDAGELRTLAEAGIIAIGLRATAARDYTIKAGDNAVLATATFTRANGTTGTAGDVSFGFRPGNEPVAGSSGANGGGNSLPQNIGPDDFGVGPAGGQPIDPQIESAIQTLTSGSADRSLSIFDLPSDAAAFDRFAMGEMAALPALTAPAALQSLANQAMPATLRALDAPLPFDAGLDTMGSEVDIARKLALLRQDMAGFGGRFGETSREWRTGDGLRALEFFA